LGHLPQSSLASPPASAPAQSTTDWGSRNAQELVEYLIEGSFDFRFADLTKL
jgi:hypothetical protein